jgi:hypothetical protein
MHLQAMVNEIPDLADQLAASIEQMADHGELHALASKLPLHASCQYEAGGMKWDVGQVTIRNAHVHDNDCRGLWADINAHDALI